MIKPSLQRALDGLTPLTELEVRLAARGISATNLLAAHGIPVVDGFFSALALERALSGTIGAQATEHECPVGDNPVEVLATALRPAGINIERSWKRHGWHLAVTAPKRRLVHTMELVNEPGYADVKIDDVPVSARLYFVKTRHSGGAYFIASRVEGQDAVPLHFFVLLSEPKVWVASSSVLAAFARTARGEPLDHDLERVRFSPSAKVNGPLRVWFPKGVTSLDLLVQVRDENLNQVLQRGEGR